MKVGKRAVLTVLGIFSGLLISAATLGDKSPYVVVMGPDSTLRMTDSLFYDIAYQVIFPVGVSTIPESNTFRELLEKDVKPYLTDNSYSLEWVMVRGAASPEGPYAGNLALSQRRAEALLQVVSTTLRMPDARLVRRDDVGEDYALLLLLMRRRGDSDYPRVAQVIDSYRPDQQQEIKAALYALDRRRVWDRLLRDYFPEMRAARVVLAFRHRPVAPPVPVPAPAPEPVYTPVPVYTSEEPLPPEPTRRREYLSVKTNVLLDVAYMPGYDRWCPIPNIAVEYYPLHGHFTFGASFDCPWWQDYDDHKYFQVRNYQLETRYYLRSGDVDRVGYGNGMAFRGLYLQGYVHAGLYSIMFDADRGWIGEGAGAGVGIGYVIPLAKKGQGRWRLELGAQLGVMFTKYDPYQYESPLFPDLKDNLYYYKWYNWGNFFKKRQHSYTWFGPTRVGVTLTYDLLYRRKAKKGVSFKSWEAQR